MVCQSVKSLLADILFANDKAAINFGSLPISQLADYPHVMAPNPDGTVRLYNNCTYPIALPPLNRKNYQHTTQLPVIGITSGCWDLIHPLHVDYFNKCKKLCDHLFVLVDTDRLIRENKNKSPLINETDRAYMVDNLRAVDGCMIVDSLEEQKNVINEIFNLTAASHKVVVFKNKNEIYGKPLVVTPGVENVVVPDINRFNSTTQITQFLKNKTPE